MKLRVWWITNPPSKAKYYEVNNVKQAIEIIHTLGQKEVNDPTVVSNAAGLQIFEDGEWTEYYDGEGRDINEIMDEEVE